MTRAQEETMEMERRVLGPEVPRILGLRRGIVVGVAVVAVFAILPLLPFGIPGVFGGPFNTAGTMQVLAVGLVFAGLAISYDLLLGYTGLLSFGHALYFALGVYLTNMFMRYWEMSYALAGLTAVLAVAVIALVTGAIALRVRGVAFAMVTLAFAEAFHIFVISDPMRISGGEEGLPLATAQVPGFLLGVVNLRNTYWIALAFVVFAFLVAWLVVTSRAGRVWQAIRENEDRVELLGLVPFGFKLLSFVVASTIAAVGGVVYILIVRGSTPFVASALFTLAVLVMVVFGGVARLWGAALGGFVYAYLSLRLPALSRTEFVRDLPDVLAGPLTEPLFIFGVLFIALVMFAPGGMASLIERVVGRPLSVTAAASGVGKAEGTVLSAAERESA
jgi:branched-chain amino acid transport system permease protein